MTSAVGGGGKYPKRIRTILAQKIMKQAKNNALKAFVSSKKMVVVVFVLSVSSFFRSLRLYIMNNSLTEL